MPLPNVARRAITAVVMSLATLPALAHAKPKTMTPEANATVAAPAQVSVFFTEALEPKFSSLHLMDAQGAEVSKDKSVVDPANAKHMTLSLPKLGPGTYRVHWMTAALDGHRMDGDYSFKVQ